MSCGVLMKLSWNSGAICAGIPTFRQQLYCDDDVLRFRFETFIGTSSVHNLAGSILRTNFVSDILLTQSGGQTLADTILRAILRTKYCERGLAYKILRTNHAPSPRFSFSSVRVSASCRFATSLSPLRSRWCVCRNIFRARASRLACRRRYHAPVAQRFARTNIGTRPSGVCGGVSSLCDAQSCSPSVSLCPVVAFDRYVSECAAASICLRDGFLFPPTASPHHRSIRGVPLSSTVATMRLREYLPGEDLTTHGSRDGAVIILLVAVTNGVSDSDSAAHLYELLHAGFLPTPALWLRFFPCRTTTLSLDVQTLFTLIVLCIVVVLAPFVSHG